ncbi:sugar ABC transporter ATP-binding protein [Neomoorella thermoacetica]|uniref:sugar ABC transporter ATP-binding protein n=1 Tax=Neomoorella thermoacetica TaxID=1525 RepID=UPI0030CCF5FE
MQQDYILEMENITKTFSGVRALNNVKLKVKKGTVHALVGENGAGKSTLMKILIGIYKCDSGTIKFKGKTVHFQNTRDSLDAGISMIHQELCLIPHMTVAENIFLGREPVSSIIGWVKEQQLIQYTKNLLDSLKIDIDPAVKINELSIANRQLVEIAKAISYNAELIIMDEPTSAITEREVSNLFKIIRSLTEKGISIIYISHKLNEIFEIADEITVLRDGEYVDTDAIINLTKEKIIEMMVGRELKQLFPKKESQIKDTILEVKNLSHKNKFRNISFSLRKGEILGIAGLMGAGRTEVMESIFGLRKLDEGEIIIKGKKVRIKSPEDAIKNKIAFLTEDRKRTGLFLKHSVKDNMLITSIKNYLKGGMIVDHKKTKSICKKYIEMLKIKTPNLEQVVEKLSGGNQQKILIAKWLLTEPEILILDEPTRGIDVGAKAEIHSLMSSLAQEGRAIIMISSELPEILGMSDRIIVMHEGKIAAELSRQEANQDLIMKYATGMHINN